jgi:NAD(P)-dependent dehydrogenase (short-subunit alcohol dehydrogenase family)
MTLTGKSIIVSGGVSGIGLAVVTKFLLSGASVVVLDINERTGMLLENQFRKRDKKVKFIKTDVCNHNQVRESIEEAISYLKTIDVLVNNAGSMVAGGLMETTEEQWDNLMSVNVKSIYNTCKEAIPYFLKQERGNIINMASVFGIEGTSDFTCYSTTKAAVIGFTRSLAGEMARYHIRVNCVSPGIIMTPMLTKMYDIDNTKINLREYSNYISNCFPLTESFGDPNDVANAACFLASDDSQWMTGNNMVVDGGYLSESAFTKFHNGFTKN